MTTTLLPKPKNSNAVSVSREVEEDQMPGPGRFQKFPGDAGHRARRVLLPEKIADTYFYLAEKHRSNRTIKFDPRSFSDRPGWNH